MRRQPCACLTACLLPLAAFPALLVAAPATAEIPSTAAWVDTPLSVTEGKCYRLTAAGDWTGSDNVRTGPRGTAPSAHFSRLGPPADGKERTEYFLGQHPKNALIARFKSQKWSFLVADGATFLAPTTATLQFRIGQHSTGRVATLPLTAIGFATAMGYTTHLPSRADPSR